MMNLSIDQWLCFVVPGEQGAVAAAGDGRDVALQCDPSADHPRSRQPVGAEPGLFYCRQALLEKLEFPGTRVIVTILVPHISSPWERRIRSHCSLGTFIYYSDTRFKSLQ